MDLGIADKTALVFGAGGGLGGAIARALAAEGAKIAVADINADAAQATVDAIAGARGKAKAWVWDLADLSVIGDNIAAIEADLGPVDILVNNAGMQHVAPVESFPVEKWDAIVALNLTAAFHTVRRAVPHMKAQSWGRIVNVASAHSKTASPFKSAYIAAKHGLDGFTKTIALELARSGVTANCVSPGYAWTPLVENQIPDTMKARGLSREEVIDDVLLAKQPTKKFVQPAEIGALAVFLCREDAGNVTGANWSIDGGWTAE